MKGNMKKFTALTMALAASCSCVVSAAAADTGATVAPAPIAVSEKLAESTLYYGTVKEIIKDERDKITAVLLDSQRSGEYLMHISEDTVWVDSGNKSFSDPKTLKEDESIYVFHSTAVNTSLPPQTAAFAVVRNVPQDAQCAMYMTVDEVQKNDEKVTILANNGTEKFSVTEETTYAPYLTKNVVSLKDIHKDSHIVVWYGAASETEGKQASHVMVLPEKEQLVTRGEVVSALYAAAGNPEYKTEPAFNDLDKDDPIYEAAAWAQEKGIVAGYSTGSFGADDTVRREQMITIVWRYAGSPMLMDYTGLSDYEDVEDISGYAMQAMMWAHQQGLFEDLKDNRLDPKGGIKSDELYQALEKADRK